MHSKTGRAALLPINAHRSGGLGNHLKDCPAHRTDFCVSQAAGAVDTAGNLAHELIHLVKDLWRSTLDPRHRLANHEVVDRSGYKNAQCAAGHDR
ncbi:hypothetical protein CIP107509_02230 [Corynebacterium diphtheriae]|nr:hypothetical protein CIP107509_02230 [Corynebacterium diphtheriae]